MKTLALLVILSTITQFAVIAQSVTKVRFEQSGKTIVVTYDLSELEPNQTVNIELYCSEDGGKTYGNALNKVKGDIGKGIKMGKNKRIIWDVLLERKLLSGDVSFKIIAERSPQSIGQIYGGGVIFYIDESGKHGLISASVDLSSGTMWGCVGTSSQGTRNEIGKGAINTLAVVTRCKEAGIAARICYDLDLYGYSDWFLPSIDELELMYHQKSVIGGFTNNFYWSSSEEINSIAKTLYFGGGGQGNSGKYSKCSVRAIRAF